MYKKYTHGIGMPNRLYRKIWLIMRLTTIILLITLIQVSAATRAQNVTLKKTDASLKSIFTDIRKQTGYMVVAPSALINKAKPVSVNLINMPLKEAMSQILENQNLDFEIQDNSIVVSEKQPTFLDNIKAAITAIDVHGHIVDEKGQPLPGVTVKLKDEIQVTTTDKDGNFILKRLNEKAVLVISYIGYLTKEVNATADLGMIALEISNSKLDEVQIQAYGTTSRRLTTGDIGTVKAVDIAKQPVSNPILALQGRVAGIEINQQTGVPGGSVNILIRGQNSLSGGAPLYIVNGVPYAGVRFSNAGPALGSNLFNWINPSDIESIDVLKDADATAIYGSRGSNGVILITTKTGKSGKTKFDFNIYKGIARVAKKLDLLNTPQYLAMRHEAIRNDGLDTSSYPYNTDSYKMIFFSDLLYYDQNRFTDWQKVFIGKAAQYDDFQSTITGGTGNTQFLLGGTYHKETTVFPGELSDHKASVNLNINNQSDDGRFKLALTAIYTNETSNFNNIDYTQFIFLAPNAPALYNPNGTINWGPSVGSRFTFNNPIASQFAKFQSNTNNLIANGSVSYRLAEGLIVKSTFGYNAVTSNQNNDSPIAAIDPSYNITTANANFGVNNGKNWIVEPQLLYNKAIGKNNFDFLLGTSFQKSSADSYIISANNYNSDALLGGLAGAGSYQVGNVNDYSYKYTSVFSRLTYNYAEKYLIGLNVRRDGSDKFGPGKRFGNFGSVGLGWIFSKEKFIQDNLQVLSFGKLRMSYGITGNDQVSPYGYISTYSPVAYYQGARTLTVNNLANPNYSWETSKKFEMGLDLGFFSDRLLFSGSYYRNKSSNQLTGTQLPAITGFINVAGNSPATIQNSGFEGLVSTVIIRSDKFKWSSSFNISFQRNKLLAYPDLANSYSDMIIGKPTSIFKVLHFADVNTQTGQYEFTDHNGNLTYDPNYGQDKTAIIDLEPKYYGGMTNTFNYNGFEFGFTLQFIKQIGRNFLYNSLPGSLFGGLANQPVAVLNRWQKPGDITNIERFNANFALYNSYGYSSNSDAFYQDASFVRLKNLDFSYTFSQVFLKKAHLDKLRIYIQGQNLLTITKFKGLDPENQNINTLPPLRVITAGMEITF